MSARKGHSAMKTEELYAEVPCRQCGKNKLKSSSFCPHCGHVQEESWLDRLRGYLGGGGDQAGSRNPLAVVIAVVVLAGAAVLAVNAILEGRYSDLISIAIFVLIGIRAFFRMRNAGGGSGQTSESRPDQTVSHTDDDDLATHYVCENCATQVAGDATQCPKCGSRFS
jgi:RNA polymerase subunit RPABC4/transcription elongation factor Spt4